MDEQQLADEFRVDADVYMARADRAMARLAALSSSDSNEGSRLLRYMLRRDVNRSRRCAQEARRHADRLSRYAERRMAEYAGSRRSADDSIREEEQLGAQSQRNTDMVGASESAIARVLKRVREDADEKDDESEEEGRGDRKRRKVSEKQSCVVCMEEFKDGSEVVSTPCSHFFHEKCIVTWLKRKPSCPLCRHEVVVLD